MQIVKSIALEGYGASSLEDWLSSFALLPWDIIRQRQTLTKAILRDVRIELEFEMVGWTQHEWWSSDAES